jgi:ribosomal protein S1
VRSIPLLAYEKSPSPEEVIKRAEAWGKIFSAKDKGEPIEVVITKKVKPQIYEILFEDTVRGLLKSPEEHNIGETVKAKIVIADYVKKKLRTKLYKEERVLKVGSVARGKVLKVSGDGGLVVSVEGKKVYIPKNRLGPARTFSLKDLKEGELECLILRVDRGKVIGEILRVKI